jgi:hypothetical protein
MSKPQNFRESPLVVSLSLLFLALGLFCLWLLKVQFKIDGDAVLVASLVLPALIYMIFSGRLSEFKGPGGLSAKFTEMAAESVKVTGELVSNETMAPYFAIPKTSLQDLYQQLRSKLPDDRPILMTVILGKKSELIPAGPYYSRRDMQDYLELLTQSRRFRFVAFLSPEQKLVACMRPSNLLNLIKNEELGEKMIRVINENLEQDLLSYTDVVRDKLSLESTNATALRLMTDRNLEALPIVDKDERLSGVVERETVIARLVLALAN